MADLSTVCYEQIEHTGDIGIKVYGESLQELFSNAALGMFDLMVDCQGVGRNVVEEVEVAGDNLEELLVNWLQELNYLFVTEQTVFVRVDITRIDEEELTATVYGDKINPRKNEIKKEIKAVTYHEIDVRKVNNKWRAQVIFDI
ncbi:archease [candidate division KSB1 bacterium]|nr:archease [candidate division KSB1 bacterium]